MSLLGRVFGYGEVEPKVDDSLEMIGRLAVTLKSGSLLEDRRYACGAINELCKTEPKIVALNAFDAMVETFKRDFEDEEILLLLIESFINVIDNNELADIFLKEKQPFEILIDVEGDYQLRLLAQNLIQILAEKSLLGTQKFLLGKPESISKLVLALNSKQEVYRNGTFNNIMAECLVTVKSVVRGSEEVKKLVVFNGIFEILLEIVEAELRNAAVDEDGTFESIIPMDCLELIGELIDGIVPNQNYFRESDCLSRLALIVKKLLGLPLTEPVIARSLEIVVTFVTQQFSKKSVVQRRCFELFPLVQVVSSFNGPAFGAACEALKCLSSNRESLCTSNKGSLCTSNKGSLCTSNKGSLCTSNKETLCTSNKGSLCRQIVSVDNENIPFMVLLIRKCLNPTIDIELRVKGVSLFGAILSNEEQLNVASMLAPSPSSGLNQPAGSLILQAIFTSSRKDPWQVWIGCSLMAYVVTENDEVKRKMFNYVMEDEQTFLEQLMSLLGKGSEQSEIGVLCLLCEFFANSPSIAQMFISSEHYHLQRLVELIAQSNPITQSLAAFAYEILDQPVDRIGTDQFKNRLLKLKSLEKDYKFSPLFLHRLYFYSHEKTINNLQIQNQALIQQLMIMEEENRSLLEQLSLNDNLHIQIVDQSENVINNCENNTSIKVENKELVIEDENTNNDDQTDNSYIYDKFNSIDV